MTEVFDLVRRMGEDIGRNSPAWGVLLRVTVLLLVTIMVAFALRRSSAALRHMIWALSLVGTLLIPLCYWVLPAWQWAVLPQRQPSASSGLSASPSPSIAAVVEDSPSASRFRSAQSPHPFAADLPLPAAFAGESVEVPTTLPATVTEHSPVMPAPQPRWSWSALFALGWALGTIMGLAWIGIGVVAAWHVARHARSTTDSQWHYLLRQLLDQCGSRRAIEVRDCSQVSVPMTWGLRRPVVLVPAGSAAWSEEIKRSVLLHELGHIRRGDCLMLLLGRLACVAYWFHPLAWLAVRQLRKTSEQAADDLVLASSIAPPDYAEHLVGIAARMRGLHLFGQVALPMASTSDLEGRVLAILDPRRNHRSLKRKTCWASMVLAVLLLIPCAIVRLGYAQYKNAQEPTAGNRNVPAEGQQAAEKQPLPQPDDRKAQLELTEAEANLNAAETKAKAADINVKHAKAAKEVADAEFEANKKANDRAAGSVPKEWLNRLMLKCRETDLAIEKARLDLRIAGEETKVARAIFEKAKFRDDRKAQWEWDVAEAEAKYNGAKLKAEDDVNVRYATAVAAVAKAEYAINRKANEMVPGSVPEVMFKELLLKCKETDLAVEKTRRDQQIAGEEAKVAKAAFEKAKRKAAEERPTPPAPKGTSDLGPAKARTTNAAPAEPPPALLTAFGKVVDPAGKPVAGATVYLREWSTFRISQEPYNQNLNDILATVQTDSDGAFRLENVAAKPLHDQWLKQIPWDVVVVAKPYAIAWQHLSAPQQSKPVTISLAPEAKVTGRVTDQQGRPIQNADVKVFSIGSLGGQSERRPGNDPETLDLAYSRLAPAAKTDADGKVSIAGLPRELLLGVEITHDDFRRNFISIATSDQPQPAIAEPEYAEGKRTTHLEAVYSTPFSLALGPPLPRLVGRVTAADSKKPLPQIKVLSSGGLGIMTDQDGRFVLKEVRESRCRLFVLAPNGSDYLGRVLLVDVPNEKKEVPLDIELARGEILSGNVADAVTGNGVAGVTVWFDCGIDINKATVEGPIVNSVTTDSAGRFRLAAPPGKGKVKISGPVRGYDPPDGGYPEPNVKGFFKEVEVVAGKPIAELTFTIHRGPATIDPKHAGRTVAGNVVDPDGKPVAGAQVGPSFWFVDTDRYFQPVQSDQEGHFSFRVPPRELSRDVIIVAIHKGRKLRGHMLLPEAKQADSATTPVDIRLGPTGIVTGRVLEGDKPIVGVGVEIVKNIPMRGGPAGAGLGIYMDRVKTDENGRFEFPLVEADQELGVSVNISGYTLGGNDPTRVSAGQTLEVKPFSLLRLDKSVAGIVVDLDGRPLAGAYIGVSMRSGGQIPYAFTWSTGENGRFRIPKVPNVPLRIMAFIESSRDAKDRTNRFPVYVDAEPGQTDVRIVLDPKLVRKKK